MIFYIRCTNKECKKEVRPLIDKKTIEAHCPECGKIIEGISIYMRRQLLMNNQTLKNERSKEAWATYCKSCKGSAKPKQVKGDFECALCGKPIEVNIYFKNAMKNVDRL